MGIQKSLAFVLFFIAVKRVAQNCETLDRNLFHKERKYYLLDIIHEYPSLL